MKSIDFTMGSSYFRHGKQQYAKIAMLKHHKKKLEESFDFLKFRFKGNVLIGTGWVQCEDYINKYKIEMTCVAGYEPCSKILEPIIKPSKEIHMYDDHSLCLHYPPDLKWSGWTPIYKYTVPWIIEWIHYYEIYLVNGFVWTGPESPVHFKQDEKNLCEDVKE